FVSYGCSSILVQLLPVVGSFFSSFFFIHPPPPAIYTLSLHDALPIFGAAPLRVTQVAPEERVHVDVAVVGEEGRAREALLPDDGDRKSTRLNSSHLVISYAVFCLKKKKTNKPDITHRQSYAMTDTTKL